MYKVLGLFAGLLVCQATVASVPTTITPKMPHMDWLDKSIAPGDDFYHYANGSWQKNNPIPADYATWGSFHILNEKVQKQLQELVLQASKNTSAPKGSIEQKVGDFYFSGMDEARINQLGAKPLDDEFNRINQVSDLSSLLDEVVHLHQMGVNVFFNFGSMQDFKDSKQMIGALVQSGLGLPDRDYYLKTDEKFQKIRTAYLQYIANMLQLLGESAPQAKQHADSIMKIETQMAKASLSQVEQRDPYKTYHMMTVASIDELSPNFKWSTYLGKMGQGQLKQVNWMMPGFFKEMNSLLKSVSLDDWKIYMRWHLVDAYSDYLSQPFVDESFKMNQVISGVEKQLPRWKRVISTENGALGFAIGKMYVDKYFSSDSKKEVLSILGNIRKQLARELETISWMTPETQKAAIEKLKRMEDRVGYPDKWWDYSKLEIERNAYALNVIRANQFLMQRDLNKIGKPVDRTEWAMTPQTVNAYYDPSMNSINLPAGILQPPFFDPEAPLAINYGAIGFVIGHEITHGFDDQGAKFDAYGNLNDWWTAKDKSAFEAATQCVAKQYSNYVVNGDLHLKGKLVVGEATADLGGITLAYRAFKNSAEYKEAKTIDGFTPDQQFFFGTAFVWASNIRPEQLRNMVTVDPHPPAQYRVNGSLANITEFKKAFNLPDNSPMVNSKQCVIW